MIICIEKNIYFDPICENELLKHKCEEKWKVFFNESKFKNIFQYIINLKNVTSKTYSNIVEKIEKMKSEKKPYKFIWEDDFIKIYEKNKTNTNYIHNMDTCFLKPFNLKLYYEYKKLNSN